MSLILNQDVKFIDAKVNVSRQVSVSSQEPLIFIVI